MAFLTLLPFHGAGDGRVWLMDSYVSSYTPTLKALIDARARLVTDTSEPLPNILVITQTVSVGLLSAGPELNVMKDIRNVERPIVDVLDEQEAMRDSVLESLQSHNGVHFTCHGSIAHNPSDSSLHLLDGDTLRLNNIVKAHPTRKHGGSPFNEHRHRRTNIMEHCVYIAGWSGKDHATSISLVVDKNLAQGKH